MVHTSDNTSGPRWSVVLCYYNEAGFIFRSIESLIALYGPSFRLVLVDNGSTDGTTARCHEMLQRRPDVAVEYLVEREPGHVNALECGLAAVRTPFVAFWDADTCYPPTYLAEAERLLERPGTDAAMAANVEHVPGGLASWLARHRVWITSKLLRRQAHTGTFGQCFRTDSLRAVGGPKSIDWPFVLYDHELMHRIFRSGGHSAYHPRLWCATSPRRSVKSHVRWTLSERLLYHVLPFAFKDWFFYEFLTARFKSRRLSHTNLRERDWEDMTRK